MSDTTPSGGEGDRLPTTQPLLKNQANRPRRKPVKVHSTRLERSYAILVYCVLYIALAVATWTMTCIAAVRPINGHSYGYDFQRAVEHKGNSVDDHSTFTKSDRYVRATRVIQSIVSVLTIPLTSAVCAQAAVVYLQLVGQSSRGPTLRQTMTLADKAWTEPWEVIKILFRWDWKRKGSRYFGYAVVLTLLGSVISPLQAILVSYNTIHIPLDPSISMHLGDIYEAVGGDRVGSDYFIDILRNKLISVQQREPLVRLWSRNNRCNPGNGPLTTAQCSNDAQNANYLAKFKDGSYWAQPPITFNTGLMTQYAPRLNSSAKFSSVPLDSVPTECKENTDALYMKYSSGNDFASYNVSFCVPGSREHSPWQMKRTRQDFTEELYIQAHIVARGFGLQIKPGDYVSKITLNTTAGYFELPNYMNKQIASGLMDEDPVRKCNMTPSCAPQWARLDIHEDPSEESDMSKSTAKRGPLATIAIALFGPLSFIDDTIRLESDSESSLCYQYFPLGAFFVQGTACIGTGSLQNTNLVARLNYISNFLIDQTGLDKIELAFNHAAFITHDMWMTFPGEDSRMDLRTYDGPITQIPALSKASMIVLSILLGIFLTCLLATAVFSAAIPRWTEKLDSFAMMRIGAARPQSFPLLVSYEQDRIVEFDKIPGWIGDGSKLIGEEEKRVRELELGSTRPINKTALYRRYEHDNDMARQRNIRA